MATAAGDGDHQRDPGRVVESRLAFEDGACTIGAAPPPQYGVDRGRVGRGQGDGDEERDRPVEPEHEVTREREPSRRGHGSQETEREDRASRSPRRAKAGSKSAVEEDHEQGDGTDLLKRDDRQLAGRGDPEQACHDADREERRRARQTDALEERGGRERRQEQADGEG